MESNQNQINSNETMRQLSNMSKKRPLPNSISDAFSQMSSKQDLYHHLDKNLQYYVCPYTMFTKDYAKDIFSEKKQLVKKKHIHFIEVPKYDELSVKNLYDKFMSLGNVPVYFPDKYPKGRQCDRDYMFNIVNTLKPDMVEELIEHAVKQRHDPKMESNQAESVLISDRWRDELKSLPMTNRKKGKMVALLKQKSKIVVQHKPRKSFEAKDVFKKLKTDDTVLSNVTMRQQPSLQATNQAADGRKGK